MTIDLESLDANPNVPAPGHVKFFPRNSALFFMDSTGSVFSMAGGLARVVVDDIKNPSAELNLISGAAAGDMIIAIQITIGGDDIYTIYAWDATPNGGSNPPFSVDGLSGGIWVAVTGRFQNQSIESVTNQNFIRFFFDEIGDLKSPTTYHGSIAHLHAVGDPVNHGTLNYAHADNWRMLKDHNDDDEVVLTPAAIVDINFGKLGATANVYQSLTLDQNTALTETNAMGGVRRVLRIKSGTPGQTLAFPSNWEVFGNYNTNGTTNLIVVDCVSPSVKELRDGGTPPAAAYIAFIVQDVVGDVVGPATATDEAVVRYDQATGKLTQNSLVLINDAGDISTPGLIDGRDVSVDGGVLDGHVADTVNPHATGIANLGAGTLTELNATLIGSTLLADTRNLTAGAGLVGGGNLSTDRTFDVVANADGSLVITANDVGVGVLANDTQHGVRGGGSQHADVVPSGAAGFISGLSQAKLDGLGGHGTLTGLGADDHTQYTLADGTRPFSGVISGITPTLGSHLTTRDYVDNAVQGIEWQDSIFDRDLASAPGGPAVADRYIVAAGASGVWAGHDDDIATWSGTAWIFTTPTLGMIVGVDDEVRTVRWNGSAWVFFGTTVDHGNLSGLGDDDHPQYHDGSLAYTGALNMGGNAISNVGLVDGRNVSVDGGVLDAHVASTSNPHSTDLGNLGTGDLAELNALVTDATLIADTRTITAGTGLTGGGTLEADRTINVGAHADGSIALAADTVQVGVLATDAQHGARGGGTQHLVVVSAGNAGFMSGAQSTDHDTLTDGPASNADALHGHVPTASSLYSYNFLTATDATDPGSGNFKFNNGTVSSVSAIYFDDLAASALSLSAPLFGSLVVGTEITFEQVNDHSKSVIFEITSITDNGGWWTLGVTYRDDVGSLFTAAAECSFSLHSGTKVKGYYQNIGYSSFDENYRVRSIASNSSANISFAIPDDFVSVISLSIRGYTDGTVIDQNIDFSSTYAGLGESKTEHTETDTTTTHSYTAGVFTDTDLLPVFSNISAGDTCGLLWDNKGIGSTKHVLRVIMAYNAG